MISWKSNDCLRIPSWATRVQQSASITEPGPGCRRPEPVYKWRLRFQSKKPGKQHELTRPATSRGKKESRREDLNFGVNHRNTLMEFLQDFLGHCAQSRSMTILLVCLESVTITSWAHLICPALFIYSWENRWLPCAPVWRRGLRLWRLHSDETLPRVLRTAPRNTSWQQPRIWVIWNF